MVEGLGQIALTVTDLERAKKFYGGALGLPFLFDAGTMAFYQCGPVRLMLGIGEQVGPVGRTILYYRVTGIAEAFRALASAGVSAVQEPHEVARMPGHTLWLAFVNDPDGNLLALMEEVSDAE
jgi:methylmalonyl-CoA/ethylmalonyl-CoA epimerase